MTELIDQFKMEADFEGLIQLLARNLYSDPDVFVRELIQNGHDSVVRRQQIEPELAGALAIGLDHAARTITFSDNGIGMDRADIKKFLAVIGSTGTGTARASLADQDGAAAYALIGQFGIGLLSAFVVAEKVVVRTRKLGSAEAFAWHNTGSPDCLLYHDVRAEVGSDIVVTLAPAYEFLLEEPRLEEIIRRYCDFLPFPIELNGRGPINRMQAPWHRETWGSAAEQEAAYKLFVSERYRETPIDVLPVRIDEPFHARGVLYIPDRAMAGFQTTGVLELFIRRMFVRDDDRTLLPPWATFIRGVIDSPDLQPTAARDNIQRDSAAFSFLQARLGELILARLSELAQERPPVFHYINRYYHHQLKGMALASEEFFLEVAELLLFETNRGMLSLAAYRQLAAAAADGRKASLYYLAYDSAAAQFYRLADARGWCVINAGRIYEEELLAKYQQQRAPELRLRRLDDADDAELFERLSREDAAPLQPLAASLERALRSRGLSQIVVRLRRFLPADLPAIMLIPPEAEAEEQLRDATAEPWFQEGLEDIVREVLAQQAPSPIYLLLNAAHPLLPKLTALPPDDALAQELLEGIYHSALLYVRKLLTKEQAAAMHGQYVRALSQTLAYYQLVQQLQQQLEEERRRRNPYRNVDSA